MALSKKPPNSFDHNIGNLAAFALNGGCLGAVIRLETKCSVDTVDAQ